ncbi:hypothetical protein U9M48_011626 [Paspalum notatum var. saurae]|uniref:Uncharacterized protein n=1 Tax=Paspalum notatum var. saurae TaxID=547442 RepID=A0AAQ3WHW2_PASNO
MSASTESSSPCPCDKVFMMTIGSYSEAKKLLPNGKCVISDPVDVGGHSWRIAFYPNGKLAGTTASMSLFLMLDEDDATAADEGIQVTFKFMLHQVGESSVLFRSAKIAATFTGRPPNARGFERFVSRDAFEMSVLSKSDRFTIRCHLTVFPPAGGQPAVETSSSSTSSGSAPLSGLQADLGRLLATKEGADVELEVRGEVFAAHKSVLAARSPVFMEGFFGAAKEEDTDYALVGDMSPEAFDALLHYMYTDALPEMAMDSLQEEEGTTLAEYLFIAAERYDLKDLKALTEKKLCDRIGVGTVLLLLALAEQYQCSKLKSMCLRFIGSCGDDTKAIMETGSNVESLARSCPSVVKDVIVTILDGIQSWN